MTRDIKITTEVIGEPLHGLTSIYTGNIQYPEDNEVIYEVEPVGDPRKHIYNLDEMFSMFDVPLGRVFPNGGF